MLLFSLLINAMLLMLLAGALLDWKRISKENKNLQKRYNHLVDVINNMEIVQSFEGD